MKEKIRREEKWKAKKLKEEKKKASWRKKMSMTSFVSDEPDLFKLPWGAKDSENALGDITEDGSDDDV